ncbi:PH domain-containing protein [Cellulomonas rhizosphaerae]|uniref:PH domain-containing protein n=1 Tax=Cellulomonas rhizosphaerae TaxID=2293719 RepID=UPI0010FDE391|nr:PH domain-containing protein [Cellulomonas rhizosphaerae]
MSPTHVFSSRYGRWLTIAASVAAVVAVVAVATHDGLGAGVQLAVPAALVVLVVWAMYWRPRVEVSDGLVEVRNVWRTATLPWPTYRGSTLKLSLVLHTTDGDVPVWAAPRSSSSARRLRRGRDESVPAAKDGVVLRQGTAEAVVEEIERRQSALTAAGYLPATAEGVHVQRRTHTRTVAGVVVLAVATAAVLLLG